VAGEVGDEGVDVEAVEQAVAVHVAVERVAGGVLGGVGGGVGARNVLTLCGAVV
jgi:hypothetical protein